MKNRLKVIGKISKLVGIKGQVKLQLNWNIEIINEQSIKLLFYENKNIFFPLNVKTISWKKKDLMIQFKNMNSIEDVSILRNKEIYIDKKHDFIKINPNWMDFKIFFNNQSIESIKIMNNKHYFLLQIQIDNKKIWVPLVDEYICSIDNEKQVLILKNLERLY